MRLRKGVLKSFNSGAHTATVQLASSYNVYLEDVAVARNLPSAEMIAGRKVAVVWPTPYGGCLQPLHGCVLSQNPLGTRYPGG